jgi:hypothetical protein
MDKILLALILLVLIAKIAIDWRDTQRITAFYDSLAEMLADMIRELIKKTEGKK